MHQLQLFWPKEHTEIGDPRHVSHGPVETGHKADLDWISGQVKDDRDRRTCSLGRESPWGATGNNHGNVISSQLCRQFWEASMLTFRPAIFNRDVASFYDTFLAQPSQEGCHADGI